jgi:hypothetical protein
MSAEAAAAEVVIVPYRETEVAGGEEGERGAGQLADAGGAQAAFGVAEQGGRTFECRRDRAQRGETGGAFEELPGSPFNETILGLFGMVVGPVGINENPVEETGLGKAGEERVVGVENALLAGRYQTNPTAAVEAETGDGASISMAGDGGDKEILGHTRKVSSGRKNSRVRRRVNGGSALEGVGDFLEQGEKLVGGAVELLTAAVDDAEGAVEAGGGEGDGEQAAGVAFGLQDAGRGDGDAGAEHDRLLNHLQVIEVHDEVDGDVAVAKVAVDFAADGEFFVEADEVGAV